LLRITSRDVTACVVQSFSNLFFLTFSPNAAYIFKEPAQCAEREKKETYYYFAFCLVWNVIGILPHYCDYIPSKTMNNAFGNSHWKLECIAMLWGIQMGNVLFADIQICFGGWAYRFWEKWENYINFVIKNGQNDELVYLTSILAALSFEFGKICYWTW